MKPEPTLREKVSTLRCAGECEGFERQLVADGRATKEILNLVAQRRQELTRPRRGG
ncbi:MAG: hypothetical protein JWQ44_2940 [Chthoniobacter sp.]|nr:hypothetical protein [Chthoniobacter sp.]